MDRKGPSTEQTTQSEQLPVRTVAVEHCGVASRARNEYFSFLHLERIIDQMR